MYKVPRTVAAEVLRQLKSRPHFDVPAAELFNFEEAL